MRRVFILWAFCLAAVFIFVVPVHAVLKEANMEQSLKILRAELTRNYLNLQHYSMWAKTESENARKSLMQMMKRSNQNAMMLYSQRNDYIFDLTYACNEATELWKDFQKTNMPLDGIVEKINDEIARYDSLRLTLNNISNFLLSEEGRVNRSVCLTLATAMHRELQNALDAYKEDIERNAIVRESLQRQYEYATERYEALQKNIFVNGGQDYITILKNLSLQIEELGNTLESKYMKYDKQTKSQWSSYFILGLFVFIIFYSFLAALLNLLLIRILMPVFARRNWLPKSFSSETFLKKRPYIIATSTVLTFEILILIVKTYINQNFLIMAIDLLALFSWLVVVVFVSLLIRLKGVQLNKGLRAYLPVLTLSFVVFIFRITLTPNVLVNLLFPVFVVFITLWQVIAMKRIKDGLTTEDKIYSWITLAVMLFSVVSSWIGYTLLSVQVLIWWIMELSSLLTITFVYQLLKEWGDMRISKEPNFSGRWLYELIMKFVIPSLLVLSIMASVYWAADVFELKGLCWNIFTYDFVDAPNFKLSLIRICIVLCLYFLFGYLKNLAMNVLETYFSNKHKNGMGSNRAVLGSNLINILAWGIFFLLAVYTLGVGNTWLVVISGGLATGVGFASKDILENIYYGISLMTGRIHIGDMIEIDGVRGIVDDMNYTSTMIEATDGSVIAFQNSQLFTKNYKNLTRNHGWELASLPVGVGYGTNVHEAKSIIVDAILQLIEQFENEGNAWIDKTRGVSVLFMNFGESSVDLNVSCWVSVPKKVVVLDKMREVIYDTLNTHNIEIPFPQTDVHLKNS